MKKYSIIGLSIFIAVCIAFVFLLKRDVPFKDIDIQTSTLVHELDQEKIGSEIDLDFDEIDDYKVLFSLSNLECERIFLFKADEKYIDTIRYEINDYIEQLGKQFKDDDQHLLIEQRETLQNDSYYIVVISKQAHTIIENLKERLFK